MNRWIRKGRYLVRGWISRGQIRKCPACACTEASLVDRKIVFRLWECLGCGLLFRIPRESSAEEFKYYQNSYPGIEGRESMAPSMSEVDGWLDGSKRDPASSFSPIIDLLKTAGVDPGARVLDFGCNWGYGVLQLKHAGYNAAGYEIAHARAEIGRTRLGVPIATSISEVEGPFDAIVSRHVLEHTPDPKESILAQWNMLRNGGILLGVTPNGSAPFRRKRFQEFHRLWGEMHPVLLTDRFLEAVLPGIPLLVGTGVSTETVRKWGGSSRVNQVAGEYEMTFLARKTGE